MSNLDKLLQSISQKTNSMSGVPLFSELPNSEIEDLEKRVDDKDSFILRINSLSNLFDRINKKELDRFNAIGKSKGSRDCLIKLLKKLLCSEHNRIDEQIDKPIGMILLLRAFFIHNRNSNVAKAEKYFQIKFPVTDYSQLWLKIHYQFKATLEIIDELLDEMNNLLQKEQEKIDDDIITLVRMNFIKKNNYILKDDSIKKILVYLYTEEDKLDSEIASEFRYEIFELRELLLPVVPSIIFPQFVDNNSTKISVTPFGKTIIENYYFNE